MERYTVEDDLEDFGASISATRKPSAGVQPKKPKPLPSFSTKGWKNEQSTSLKAGSSVVYLSDSGSSSPRGIGTKRTSSEAAIILDPSPPPPKRIKKVAATVTAASLPIESNGKESLQISSRTTHDIKGKGKAKAENTAMDVDSDHFIYKPVQQRERTPFDDLDIPAASGVRPPVGDRGGGRLAPASLTRAVTVSKPSALRSMPKEKLVGCKDSCQALRDFINEKIISSFKDGGPIDLEMFEHIKDILTQRLNEIQACTSYIPAEPICLDLPPPLPQASYSTGVAFTRSSSATLVERSASTASSKPVEDDDDELWDQLEDLTDVGIISDIPSHAPPPICEPFLSQSMTLSSRSATPQQQKSHMSPYYHEVKQRLKSVFALDVFRKNQLEAVLAVMEGRDVFVLMPTGGGKSLCYQLPAVCTSGPRKGVSIVITPLVALMNDQVGQLRNRWKIEAMLWNAENYLSQQDKAALFESQVALLYVTPEKLQDSGMAKEMFQQLYRNNLLARFVIDEAHCISTWGQDFREAYTTLGSLRDQYPNVPIVALTATANRRTVDDVVGQLKLRNHLMLTQSFNRDNLHYTVIQKSGKFRAAIADKINQDYSRQSGIIYCRAKQACEAMADFLRKAGIWARHYHAGMPKEERERAATDWQDNTISVVVATIAFGMGIDKPDVRFVIHYDMPKCISGYYQETGRAGRDGKRSECILYYNYGDLNTALRMIRQDENTTPQAKERQEADVRQMFNFACNQSECRRVQLLQLFDERFDRRDCRKTCDTCQDERQTVSQDVTDIARAAVQLATSAGRAGINLTPQQLMASLRGAGDQALKAKGADRLDGFGKANGSPTDLLDLVLKRLIFKDILSIDSIKNQGNQYHTDVVEVGRNVEQANQRITIEWRPKDAKAAGIAKGGKKRLDRSDSSGSTSKLPSRGRGKARGTELADDPIENIYDFQDNQVPVSAPLLAKGAHPPSLSISAAPVTGSSSRPPRQKNVQSSTASSAPPAARVVPVTAASLPVQPCLDSALDPAAAFHHKMDSLRQQIARAKNISPQDLLDDQVLQMLSLLCPIDYASFKRIIEDGYADSSEDEAKKRAEAIWNVCGQPLLDLCVDYKTASTKSLTVTRNVADLYSTYTYQTTRSYSTSSVKPMSTPAPRPASAAGTRPVSTVGASRPVTVPASPAVPSCSSSSATARVKRGFVPR